MLKEKILEKCHGLPALRGELEKGLEDFENSGLERERILDAIGYSESWEELYACGSQILKIAEALQELGTSTLPEYSPRTPINKGYITLNGLNDFEVFVASKMAREMLKVAPLRGKMDLDELYKETFLKK